MKQLKRMPSIMYNIPIGDIKHIVVKVQLEKLTPILGKPVGTRNYNYYFRTDKEYAVFSSFNGSDWLLEYTNDSIKVEVLDLLKTIVKI